MGDSLLQVMDSQSIVGAQLASVLAMQLMHVRTARAHGWRLIGLHWPANQ